MITFRFLLGAFARRVALALLVTVALLVVGDFAEMASSILGLDDALTLTLSLYRAKLPALTLQALPLATLLGLLLTLADLESSKELLALESAGTPPHRIAIPALVLALGLSLAGVVLDADLAPDGMREAVSIETRTLGRWTWTWTLFHKPRSFFRGPDHEIYEVRSVLDEGRRLEGVSRYDVRGGRLYRLSRADVLLFRDGRWAPEGARIWHFSPEHPETITSESGRFPIGPGPSHFQGVTGQPSELSRADLDRAIAARRAQGRPLLPLLMERQDRSARPLLTFGLSLLALGLGLGPRTPTSAVEATAWTVLIATLGWTLLATMRAMGLAAMVSPATAAWLPVIIPGAVGVYLFRLRRR